MKTKEEILALWKDTDACPDFMPVLEALLNERDYFQKKLAATEQPIRRMAALEEALTPSPDTKSAYIGEFNFGIEQYDEDGDEHTRQISVPWTTIKEIMSKIKAYADKV